MIVTIDKRGSISLPASIRKDLGIKQGSHLELALEPGGVLLLSPVEFYRTVRLNDSGLSKLQEARVSETENLPDWFEEELHKARG